MCVTYMRHAGADQQAVEPLHSPRPPQKLDAIYILTPTTQNVDRIIADFAGERRTYMSAHLYFIDGEYGPGEVGLSLMK